LRLLQRALSVMHGGEADGGKPAWSEGERREEGGEEAEKAMEEPGEKWTLRPEHVEEDEEVDEVRGKGAEDA